jgi:hypothetical protein
MIDINPIDILNQRQVNVLPSHFTKVSVPKGDWYGYGRSDDWQLQDWVRSKLKGRYFIGQYPSVDNQSKFRTNKFVAFEEQKEATYFMLACPYLRRN